MWFYRFAGRDFFNDKIDYKHDLKAIISYEFPYNDNNIIIVMNYDIKVHSISTCSNSLKYFRTLCIYMMYKN